MNFVNKRFKLILLAISLCSVSNACFFASQAAFSPAVLNSPNNDDEDIYNKGYSGPGQFDTEFINTLNSGFLQDPNFNYLRRNVADIAVDKDGKIVVVGGQCRNSQCNSTKSFVARLHPDGSLDASFNNGEGVFVYDAGLWIHGPDAEHSDYAKDVLIKRDNSGNESIIVLSVYRWFDGTEQRDRLAIAAFQSDGEFNISFTSMYTLHNGIIPVFEDDPGHLMTNDFAQLDDTSDGNTDNLIYLAYTPWASPYSLQLRVFDKLNGDPVLSLSGFLDLDDFSNPPGPAYFVGEIMDFSIKHDVVGGNYFAVALVSISDCNPNALPCSNTNVWRSALVYFKFLGAGLFSRELSQLIDEQSGANQSRPWTISDTGSSTLVVSFDESISLAASPNVFSWADSFSRLFSMPSGDPLVVVPFNYSAVTSHFEITASGNPGPALEDMALGGVATGIPLPGMPQEYYFAGITGDDEIYISRHLSDGVNIYPDFLFGPYGNASNRLQIPNARLVNNPHLFQANWGKTNESSKPFFKQASLNDGGQIISVLMQGQDNIPYTVFLKILP